MYISQPPASEYKITAKTAANIPGWYLGTVLLPKRVAEFITNRSLISQHWNGKLDASIWKTKSFNRLIKKQDKLFLSII